MGASCHHHLLPSSFCDVVFECLCLAVIFGNIHNQNLVFIVKILQVCLCTLVRHKPRLAPQVVASAPSLLAPPRHHAKLHQIESLLSSTVTLLTSLPNLCSPAGKNIIKVFFLFNCKPF